MRSRTPDNWLPWLLLAIVLAAGWWLWPRPQALPPSTAGETTRPLPGPEATSPPPIAEVSRPTPPLDANTALPGFLPAEAHATIAMIRRGGPFPHRQDGSVFGNREGRLPRKPRGWYHEYTVDTPGLDHRGARRIVTGGNPPDEWYYSDDHYDSFRRFELPGGMQ